MNPSPELYMEYYSDYEFQDRGEENYDHIGDIEELVILQIAAPFMKKSLLFIDHS